MYSTSTTEMLHAPSMQRVPGKHHQRIVRFICAAGPCVGMTSKLWRKVSIRDMINGRFGLARL